jgi:hypothetical protein
LEIFSLTFILLVAATLVNGLLAGASLDQAIKQLPARRRIGALAYSTYSRASDLGPGIWWYGLLEMGAALLTIAAAAAAYSQPDAPLRSTLCLYVGAALSVLHGLVTARCAPTNFRQRQLSDEAQLSQVFDCFERWQNVRAVLQVLTFAVVLWGAIVFAATV